MTGQLTPQRRSVSRLAISILVVLTGTLVQVHVAGAAIRRAFVGRFGSLKALGVMAMLITTMAVIPATASGATSTPKSTWTQLSPVSSPPGRSQTSLAYDPRMHRLVLFGGTATNGGFGPNDTWTWNGTTWSQLSPSTSPPAVFWPSMAYDGASGQLLLFGGYASLVYFNDTWAWNGTTWTQLSPTNSPPGRENATMAYDAATKQLVLFGGQASSGFLDDTWTWDGTTWTEQSPTASPPAEQYGAMAFDPHTGQLLYVDGGGNTWNWNGATWMLLAPAARPTAPRFAPALAYDAGTGQLALFGGFTLTGNLNDTWTWNGTTWSEHAPITNPPGFNGGFPTLADDPAADQLILVGFSSVEESWLYTAVPNRPSIGVATAGNAQASVAFSPPKFDGGSPVTSYKVTATDLTNSARGGQTKRGSTSPVVVKGLTHGDSYTFRAAATNVVGTGYRSASSNAVVPKA